MNNEKLKQCPFCGSEQVCISCSFDYNRDPICEITRVECGNCFVHSKWFHIRKEAIESWNCRAHGEQEQNNIINLSEIESLKKKGG